jgi:lipopolysaccharide assembly outer membrane protein LptD (OstA)
MWEDQFAGRGRNLPYTYYGVTPGLRNAWRTVDEKGRLTTILDFDAYVAMQFNDTEWYKGSAKARRITKPGEPNYGEDDVAAAPGVRVRWTPAKDIMLGALAEYNCEDDEIALASLIWQHKLNKDFRYNLGFSHRQHRWWDYSIFPYNAKSMEDDEFNNPYFSTATFGFDHEITDAFKWDAGISWDCTENELDEISFGFEYRTDCLAFRVYCEYENGYTRIDGSKYDNDWSYGFAVYLRAFGFGTNEMYED